MIEGLRPTNDSAANLENRERPLAGKVALITGSSRGIGAAIALKLAEEGVNIIENHREKQKRADVVLSEINPLGIKTISVQADITNADERKKLEEAVVNSFDGRLDFLVLNASGPERDINVTAANALVDIFLPALSRNKGTIILLQSVPGHFQDKIESSIMPEKYAPVAKAKFEGEQSLRKRMREFEEKNVSFIVICPPLVDNTSAPAYFERSDPHFKEKNAKISEIYGLPETVTKEEVGAKVAEVLKKGFPTGHTEFFRVLR